MLFRDVPAAPIAPNCAKSMIVRQAATKRLFSDVLRQKLRQFLIFPYAVFFS